MQKTVGQQIEYASKVLLPAKRFKEYREVFNEVLDDKVYYVDPVHEFKGKEPVLAMLAKYVPRAANDSFRFELLHDGQDRVFWKWTIGIRIRFTPFHFIINGLVEAQLKDGKIVYQREYYDPMESIGIIPVVGFLYKMVLKLG